MPNKVEDISSIQEEGNVLENHQERISESLSSSDKPPVLQQSNPLAASYDSNSFEWSLKPIILWMSISGIRLNSTKSRINRAVFLAIGCLVLLVNFLTNGFSLYYFLSLLTGDYASRPAFGIAGNASGASLANMGMKHSFFVSLVLGDHLIFFIVSLTTWKKLWALMIEIQERMKLPGSFYRRCRYVSLIGLIFLLLDGCCYCYLSLDSVYWRIKPIEPLFIALGNVSHLSAMSVLAVLCVTVTAITSVIDVLNKRMEVLSGPNYPTEKLALELETWRLHHDLICRVIEQLNWCFGLILLLTISTGFVFFISISYELIFSFFDKQYEKQTALTVSLMQLCWRLFIVIVVCYRLQAKASALIRTVRRMRSTFHHQILLILNTVIVQVSQANSKLSAMEFFDVNLTLFPTLVGTTLTYLVIMCQS